MTKRTARRYIERTLSVPKLIKLIPPELLENLANDTHVDYQVKYLHGALMFKLFLFSILKSERLSTRLMEMFYNSSEFMVFSGKGGHTTKHSSIADRLRSIDSQYFEKIFEAVGGLLEKRFRNKSKKVMDILRFDSTMVSIGAKLVNYGMQVGKKASKGDGKKQLKFTIGLKGMLPSDAHLFTNQIQLSEDVALREAIVKSSQTADSIVVFDRGLQKRLALAEFDESGIYFVTRANDYIKYEQIGLHKKISGRKTNTLVFDKDILVYLYGHDNKKINTPFRLIKAKSKQSGEPILFLTNIKHLNASEISEIYHRRWDIEVFFRFIKQELNFSNLVSHNENGTKVMMYMVLITAMLILAYKKVNNIEGYKIAKLKFTDELQMEITKEIVVVCGGDPNKMKKIYNPN
jgi:hypothetical protein